MGFIDKKKVLYLFIISQFLCSCVLGKKENLSATSKHGYTNISTNKIDNLKTIEDVIKFTKSINPDFAQKNFGEIQIKTTDLIITELNNCDLYKIWNIQNWQKIDLNNDGKTDLLFTAYWYSTYHQYAVVESGSNQYELFNLSNNLEFVCKIVKPIVVDNKNELLVNIYKTDIETVSKQQMTHFIDTLTYKFNSFIERNNKVVNYDIQYIKFTYDNNFEIEIDNNQNAHYTCLNVLNVSNLKGNYYKGESRKKIDKAIFKEISKLLEYINVLDLPNEYTLESYDFSTVWLEIKFKNGNIKKIKDYGDQGTYGLNATYNKMKKIALQTDWK
ncbi:hypothetical protein EV144_106291 [Flavobacterium sp. 270]|uniref:DUF6438 domain-containing protein n=1 Tax=Flavobacterium sp. 270 TaxID=2512114 RepID=UPI001066E816|nr:hypothetical protein [Flavobacterium sp. 270]TDW46617.1 hypothetical protein EV144_106291 [Flavobacterium sp. 270]